jgi:hypothetical protein
VRAQEAVLAGEFVAIGGGSRGRQGHGYCDRFPTKHLPHLDAQHM